MIIRIPTPAGPAAVENLEMLMVGYRLVILYSKVSPQASYRPKEGVCLDLRGPVDHTKTKA